MHPRIYNIFLVFFLCLGSMMQAQFYNKEIKAALLVEQNSEFYSFKATAENMTPSDYSLRYDLMLFKEDENGNTTKSNQENRFFLEARQKVILSEVVVNYNATGKIIIVLMIYDQDDKPIGKERLVLEKGGQTPIENLQQKQIVQQPADQARPQDGVRFDGLITHKTITKAGRDFYRYFYADYFNRGIKTTVDIHITEVPGRGRTTQVSVEVGETLVWRFFTQPRKDYLKKMAAIAMQRSIAQLQRMQQQNQQLTKY